MEEDCRVDEMIALAPSVDLDPGQVSLLLSSLKPLHQGDDVVQCVQGNDSQKADMRLRSENEEFIIDCEAETSLHHTSPLGIQTNLDLPSQPINLTLSSMPCKFSLNQVSTLHTRNKIIQPIYQDPVDCFSDAPEKDLPDVVDLTHASIRSSPLSASHRGNLAWKPVTMGEHYEGVRVLPLANTSNQPSHHSKTLLSKKLHQNETKAAIVSNSKEISSKGTNMKIYSKNSNFRNNPLLIKGLADTNNWSVGTSAINLQPLTQGEDLPHTVNSTTFSGTSCITSDPSSHHSTSPLLQTPPTLSSNTRLYRCRLCYFFSLCPEMASKHESLDHPPPRPRIHCVSCSNTFLSVQALKVHLLLDHEVLKSELQSILLLTLRKCEEFRQSSTRPENQKTSAIDIDKSNKIGVAPNQSTAASFTSGLEPCVVTNDPPVPPTTPPVEDIRWSHCTNKSAAFLNLSSAEQLDEENPSAQPISLNKLPPTSESPKHSSNASSEESESWGGGSCGEDSGMSDEDERMCEVGSTSPPQEAITQAIDRHLRLMQLVKKHKSTAHRCCITVKCHLRFKSLNTLDYHKKCHDLEKGGWKCPECSKAFSVWNSVAHHLWNDHTIDMELYYCTFCSFRTPNLSQLKTEHIWIHGKAKCFTCPVCSKSVKTRKQLRNHQAVHRGGGAGGEGRFSCEECKALFSRRRQLKEHVQAVHLRTRRFRCATCGHRSATRSAHLLHSTNHTKEKKYACGDCGYRTGDHNALRRHVARHSGERPYPCPHCSYASIRSTSLRAHVSSKHPGMVGDVVFSCPLCPFTTLRKGLLVSHASKHNSGALALEHNKQVGLNTWLGNDDKIS